MVRPKSLMANCEFELDKGKLKILGKIGLDDRCPLSNSLCESSHMVAVRGPLWPSEKRQHAQSSRQVTDIASGILRSVRMPSHNKIFVDSVALAAVVLRAIWGCLVLRLKSNPGRRRVRAISGITGEVVSYIPAWGTIALKRGAKGLGIG